MAKKNQEALTADESDGRETVQSFQAAAEV